MCMATYLHVHVVFLLSQIRTGNEFFWSEYSDPFLIPLNAKDNSDNIISKLRIKLFTSCRQTAARE